MIYFYLLKKLFITDVMELFDIYNITYIII